MRRSGVRNSSSLHKPAAETNRLLVVAPLAVRLREVNPEQVGPEVTVEVAPDGVDVVGIVLRVVVLDQERRPLDTVVVRLPACDPARPREMHLLVPGAPHLLQP